MAPLLARIAGMLPLWLLPLATAAHDGGQHLQRGELFSTWNFEPWLIAVMLAALWLYLRGWRLVSRRGGEANGERKRLAAYFTGGMLLVTVALVSPLDALSAQLSSAHMVQHMLLIAAAAPLFVLSRPLPFFLWALPARWRTGLAHGASAPWFATSWRILTQPLCAWLLHGLVLWAWHAPALYQAALANPLLHDIEHASFLANALLFWWVVLRTVRNASASNGIAVALLFTTFMHGGLLAALMTFAGSPWYPAYVATTANWNLTPLEDQQLAGLVMWIPVGITYLLAGLGVLGLWLGSLERNTPNAPHLPASGGS